MSQKRSLRFRPTSIDFLEDRTVPSSGMTGHVTAAAVHAAATTGTSSSNAQSTLQAQLTAAGAQVNAAFSTFADGVRQAEVSLTAQNTASLTTTSATRIAAAVTSINSLTATLASSVHAAYGSVNGLLR